MKNAKNGKKTVKIAAAAFAAVMSVTTAAFCIASFDSNKIDTKVKTETVAAAETDMGAVKNAAQVKAMNNADKGIDNTAKNESAKQGQLARRSSATIRISRSGANTTAQKKLKELEKQAESKIVEIKVNSKQTEKAAADETVNEMGKHPGECGYGYVNEMGKHPGESGYCYNMNEAAADEEVNEMGKHPGECGYNYVNEYGKHPGECGYGYTNSLSDI